jgi:hypothetical protein
MGESEGVWHCEDNEEEDLVENDAELGADEADEEEDDEEEDEEARDTMIWAEVYPLNILFRLILILSDA